MQTYTGIYETGEIAFEHIPASELFMKLPAGSRLISGDEKDKETGKIIKKATYRTRVRSNLTIYLDEK